MVEENTFIETCKEILDIEYTKKDKDTKKGKLILKKDNIWEQIDFPPSFPETAKQQGTEGGSNKKTSFQEKRDKN